MCIRVLVDKTDAAALVLHHRPVAKFAAWIRCDLRMAWIVWLLVHVYLCVLVYKRAAAAVVLHNRAVAEPAARIRCE
jgi:hypothetical protein